MLFCSSHLHLEPVAKGKKLCFHKKNLTGHVVIVLLKNWLPWKMRSNGQRNATSFLPNLPLKKKSSSTTLIDQLTIPSKNLEKVRKN